MGCLKDSPDQRVVEVMNAIETVLGSAKESVNMASQNNRQLHFTYIVASPTHSLLYEFMISWPHSESFINPPGCRDLCQF